MLLVFCVYAQSTAQKYPFDYLQDGEEAYKKKDYAAFLDNAQKAEKLAPTHPSIHYVLARANALLGNYEEAIEDRIGEEAKAYH